VSAFADRLVSAFADRLVALQHMYDKKPVKNILLTADKKILREFPDIAISLDSYLT
jgi:hypothetical protein